MNRHFALAIILVVLVLALTGSVGPSPLLMLSLAVAVIILIANGGFGQDFEPRTRKMVGNNCLFDAALAACASGAGAFPAAQALREKCDELLIEEGMPTIPSGMPAGEQYIQALSKLMDRNIKVYMRSSGGGKCEFDVRHSAVPEDAPVIEIVHHGDALNGHWTARAGLF